MTEVPDYAFADLSRNCCGQSCNLAKRTLKIEEGVKKIGAHSFSNSFGLLQNIDGVVNVTFSYTGDPYSFPVTLPQSIEELGPAAFSGCTGFGAINIPRKVAELSDSLFMDCSNLKSIDFSRAKITRIGKEALKGCSALTNITLPNTLTVIDDGAFMGCTGLTEIVIPKSVTKISANAFRGCSNLEKITFAEKMIQIGDSAFKDCEKLSTIVSPQSVEYIGAEAFANCKSLREEIVLPDEVGFIGEHIFGGLTHLKKITFGNRVGTIGTGAFAGLTGLNQLSFNGSLGAIEEGAFTDCPITALEFKGDVEAIGDGAFKEMTGLTSVTFDKSVGTIGKEAFMNCSSLAQPLVLQGTKIVDDRAFSGCSKITSIDFGNDLTTIGQYAFNGCCAVDSIHFSPTVIDIDDSAFEGCTGISRVSYDADILNEFVEYLFPEIIYGYPDPTAENGTHVNQTIFYAPNATLVDAMMTAPWNRFYKLVCKDGDITHTTASDRVEEGDGLEFGKLSETYCEVVGTNTRGKDKKKITVPRTYTSKGKTYTVIQIGREAFKDACNLEEIELPPTLLSIGTDAFKGCTSLEAINIPDGVYRIGSNAFEGCRTLTRLTLPHSLTDISDFVFKDCVGLMEIKLHDNLKSIGESAFENCTHLNEFLVPGEMNLTTVGVRAFKNCNDLIALDVSESVDFIGESAFENCSKLDDVKLPESLKKIENKAFANCDRLTRIEIGNAVTEIGDSAFYDCARIKELKIPVTVTKVGSGAFDNCSNLAEIYLYSGDADLLGQQIFANPDCHIFVQRKDFDNYRETWENNLYVAGQSDYDSSITIENPEWWHGPITIEVPKETRPGDRIIAAITMVPEYMRLGGKSIVEKNLPRYYPGANAYFSTVAPVKHEREDWSTNEPRVAEASDNLGNYLITGVGPGSMRVETDNAYYHDYALDIYPQTGDANWNGGFDISDAVNVAHYAVKNRNILNNWNSWTWDAADWYKFYIVGADVNGDGIVTFADASAAVKLALAQPRGETVRRMSQAAHANINDNGDELVIGIAENGVIPVRLDNSMDYVALQADITVPEGMTIKDVIAGKRGEGHGLSSRRIDERTMRVALFNPANCKFPDIDEPLLKVVVEGMAGIEPMIELSYIIASDITSESYILSSRNFTDMTTSVDEISGECSLSVSDDGLQIKDASGKHITICATDGAIIRSYVARSDRETIVLSRGIYIVTVEGDIATKVIIK